MRQHALRRALTANGTRHRRSRRTKRILENSIEIPDFQKLKIEIELRNFYRNNVALSESISGEDFDGVRGLSTARK